MDMIGEFFRQASRSPRRQKNLRTVFIAHQAVLFGITAYLAIRHHPGVFALLADALLLLGIVEGALLIGWRLAQWPKSRSLEPLLLANLSPARVMVGEQAVGLAMLALVSASSLPLLTFLAARQILPMHAVWFLPLQGFAWGSVVGFGLTWWTYESERFRWWGEKVLGTALTVYLLVGGLAGEHTLATLRSLPGGIGHVFVEGIWMIHRNHPFSLMHAWDAEYDSTLVVRTAVVTLIALVLVVLMLFRSAHRLHPHYVERHYRPVADTGKGRRGVIGTAPLSWWAVRRVHQYAGRVNLYLAAGAALLYAAYLLLENEWPAWMGRQIFLVFEQNGGVATVSTLLILLAAVPAAYQYGLWDSSKTERCQRLENLLTTDLSARDFEQASWAASWSRGRGYFYAALLLWIAAALAGRMSWMQVLLAMAAAWLLLVLYFVIGLRALARSGGGTTTGFLLSVILPLSVWGLASTGHAELARILPPGLVYFAVADPSKSVQGAVVIGCLLGAGVALLSWTLKSFDADLRRSFEADLLRV